MPESDTPRAGLLIGAIDGQSARLHFLARFLEDAGFASTAHSDRMRCAAPVFAMNPEPVEDEDESA